MAHCTCIAQFKSHKNDSHTYSLYKRHLTLKFIRMMLHFEYEHRKRKLSSKNDDMRKVRERKSARVGEWKSEREGTSISYWSTYVCWHFSFPSSPWILPRGSGRQHPKSLRIYSLEMNRVYVKTRINEQWCCRISCVDFHITLLFDYAWAQTEAGDMAKNQLESYLLP